MKLGCRPTTSAARRSGSSDGDEHHLFALFWFDERPKAQLVEQAPDGALRSVKGSLRYLPPDVVSFYLRRKRLSEAGAGEDVLAEAQAVVASEYRMLLLAPAGHRLASRSDTVEMIRSYLRHTLGAGCTLAHLAALFGYSAFHLSRLYKKRTGETIGATILRERLSFVREATEAGIPAAEIAVRLGFSCATSYRAWLRSCRRGTERSP